MAAIVGIDGKIQISKDGGSTWVDISERNEYTISLNVDVAEHKVFVQTLADAWIGKQRTWMSWSGSLSGFYDDASDEIFDDVRAGDPVILRFYPSRANTSSYWQGSAILTSVEHAVNTDDFATLNVDFEGDGTLEKYP